MTLRVLDTGLNGARWNVAMSAALLELHAAGRIPDTLRLHRYPTSVLLGRSQDVAACDRDACTRRGAEIARRITGGGTVAMGPGVLAWDLVTRNPWRAPVQAAAALGRALAAALGRFRLAARFHPPGDILVDARKVAGTAGAFEGATLLHQGSLLVAADPAEMAELLGVPALPVATLAELAVPPPGMPEAARAIQEAIGAALGQAVRHEPAGRLELALAAARLADELGAGAFAEDALAP